MFCQHGTWEDLALVAVPGVIALATAAAAQTFPNLPMAVTCYDLKAQSWRIADLSRVTANGDALYEGAGRPTATVNAKGVVVTPTNRPTSMDCYGKPWMSYGRWVVSWIFSVARWLRRAPCSR
jgi:hypothetical protein